MRPVSSASPFCLSSAEFETSKSGVLKKIDGMTDIQVRMLVSSIFEELNKKRDQESIDINLIKIRDSWILKENQTTLSKADATKHVNQTMQVAFDYFKERGLVKDSLRPDSDFASYMSGWFEEYQVQSFKIMHDFCDYLCQLSLKSAEQQEIYLQSFPPEQDYLKCLDGTEERIDKLYKYLVTKEEFHLFLQAHEATILQAISSLRDHVDPIYEVHLPNYLEYSLGLVSEKTFHPQFQIPFTSSLEIHKNYSHIFKQLLATKILENIDERRNGIETKINGIAKSFPNLNFDHSNFDPSKTFFNGFNDVSLFIHINNLLNPYRPSSLSEPNFFKEDDSENFVLSQELLRKAAESSPALQVLNIFLQREDVAELSIETSTKQRVLEALKEDHSNKIFFSINGGQNVYELLNVEEPWKQEPVNHQELLFGLETLWMMGENLAGNCPISFVAINRTLNSIEENYLNERIAHEIKRFLPNQIEKIECIRKRRDIYHKDPQVTAFFNQPETAQIGNLIYGNASKEIILSRIDIHKNAKSLIDELNASLPNLDQQSFDSACQRLVLRPDCLEILQAFAKTIEVSAAKLPENFIKTCLEVAAQHNDSDIFKSLLKLGSRSGIFEESLALHYIARHNNVDLISAIISYVSEEELQYRDDDGNTVAALAASCDSADVLRVLCEKVGIDNLNQTFNDDANGLAHIAAINGSSKIIELLQELKPELLISENNDRITPLHCAVYYNKKNVVTGLGRHINISSVEHIMNFAALHDCADMIETLKDLGVNLNDRSPDGNSPIHIAINKSYAKFVTALGRAGADLTIANSKGKTPLAIAISQRNADMVKALSEGGISFDTTDGQNNNIMHNIALIDNDENRAFIKVFHDAGIDFFQFNKPNRDGNLPIIVSALEGNVTIAHALDGVGIGANQQDSKSSTLIYRAACINDENLQSLMSVGANIDHQNENGDTMLHIAACENNLSAIEILIRNGANPNLLNKDEVNPLYIAASEGYNSLMKELGTKDAKDVAFQLALTKNNLNAVENLISLDRELAIEIGDYYLNIAPTQENTPIIKLLLEVREAIQSLYKIDDPEKKAADEMDLITNSTPSNKRRLDEDTEKSSKSSEGKTHPSNTTMSSLSSQDLSTPPPSAARVLNAGNLNASPDRNVKQRNNL